MTIRDYLRNEVFSRRLCDPESHGCLVIYDPARRYHEIAVSLADEQCRVIDASNAIIEPREAATAALSDLATGAIHRLVLWLPTARPVDETAKQIDPFAVFAEVGAAFPDGDGHEYAELCRRAKPDHVSEINKMFDDGTPTFEMVDSLDQGGSWPKLKTLLGVDSAREILIALLSPRSQQDAALKADASWQNEAREFSLRSLGHKLRTKGQTRQSIADELWRLILFSEFWFDSAKSVPASLETVPRAGDEARSLVYEVCEHLRRSDDHKDVYKNFAQEVEDELDLAVRTSEMTNLGVRDTFSFEERIFLGRVIERASEGDIEAARAIWESRTRSIWLTQENRLAEWTLAARAIELMDAASRLSTPKFTSLEAIIHLYASTWRELDRHHREMEQAANQMQDDHDGLDELLHSARKAYFMSVEALQAEFVRLVEAEGWPATGSNLLSNRQLFTKVVSPLLEAGEKVAYFLVDSLRYELGVEVEKQLSDKLKVTLQPSCAQLPTYTEIGMASLMPDAESALALVEKDGKLVTTLGGSVATAPTTRFSYLQSRKGDQCADLPLDDLIRKKAPKIAERVKLLVVRTRDIDAIAHDSPHQVLDVIPALVRQIIRGLSKVAELGFDTAVIATDHGFVLFHEQEAGNLALKPKGDWLVEKTRCLLGEGVTDSSNLVMEANELGIPGAAKHYATPRTLVPYSRGQLYYHEGLSLQECVVPCLTVALQSGNAAKRKSQTVRLTLSYRQGKADRITSRRPVIDLSWPETDLFSEENEREVVVEAVDSSGSIVGLAGTGQAVNPATGCVRIKPGAALSVGLKMEDDFSGSFTVRVLDPATNALLADLPLKTAYLE
jgi:hypothetical protein